MHTALARKNQTSQRPQAPQSARVHVAIRNILHGPAVQTKLKIGPANDPAEREADRVADKVMGMPVPAGSGGAATPNPNHRTGPNPIRRMCNECQGEVQRMTTGQGGEVDEEKLVQPKEKSGAAPALSAASEGAIRGLGVGAPLAGSERAFFEPRFGQDFSHVRIHIGTAADMNAKSIDASAYTLGSNIAFARGEYSPGTLRGRRLLAHELTHVLQQRSVLATTPGPSSAGESADNVGGRTQPILPHSPLFSLGNTKSLSGQVGVTIRRQPNQAGFREATVRVRWSDDDGEFYRRLVAAVARSRGFRGVGSAALWQPFHTPTLRFHRRHSRRHPRDLNQGDRVEIHVSAHYDPSAFVTIARVLSVEERRTAQAEALRTRRQQEAAAAVPETPEPAFRFSQRFDASVASVSWIDPTSPAGGRVPDPRPGGSVSESFLTGNSGFRFSNYLKAWVESSDGTNVSSSGRHSVSGMYRSPSFLGIPSRVFRIITHSRPVTRNGIGGIEFEQTTGARTISAGVAGGVVGAGVGAGAGAWGGGKLGAAIGAWGGPIGAGTGAVIGGLIGGAIGYFAGTATANRVTNFPPIWTKLKLKIFADGNKSCEMDSHSHFPSSSYYCELARWSEYSALARQQTRWENSGWGSGNPWNVSRPLLRP